MNSLCWNCRGFGNPRSVNALRNWCATLAPDLVFLSETKIHRKAAKKAKHRLGYSCAFGVSSIGLSGGLCVYWKGENITFNLVSFSQNHICGDVIVSSDRSWRFIGIYGWPETANKYRTWELVRKLCENVHGPLVIGGDFNEILSHDEKEGGADVERRAIPEFREMMDDCSLRDLGFEGHWYTWERGITAQTMVRERLDKFVCNTSWAAAFPEASVQHLVRFKSDHTPILLSMGRPRKRKKKRKRAFKFESAWLLDDQCERVKLEDLYEKQEAYWYLRSRVAEIKDGDKNTKYFHHKASQRRRRNEIKGLRDETGKWCTEEEEMEVIVQKFYSALFTSSSPTMSDCDAVLEACQPSISTSHNEDLLREYTKEDVRATLFSMHPCKAPGPDGMHAMFYQRFWHIVGDNISNHVCNILHGICSPRKINNTNVALISKVKSPTSMTDFRPIALCNVLYKIASKAIVMRLKSILPEVISENQSAFVPGRLITNNALIALELFHTMKRRSKGRKGTIAMKLDMSKAYDRVEWTFLERLLLRLGFAERWVKVVMDWMINKAVESGDIHGARASRNGPAVSHLLFADDILLFARANRRECQKIVDILNIYEAASGQKINYDKSEVSFSKGVCESRKGELLDILKMKQVDEHAKYLGIPTIIGRSKKSVFAALKDRIWKKLQGWKEKLLSRAGKEVLIKSVIQAIPTYIMGIYKLPGKYYPNGDFLESYRGPASSFAWRSIWAAKALLKEGLIWRVGDGKSINIWHDQWVADESGGHITSSPNAAIEQVCELIDQDSKEWRYDLISKFFNDRDERCILAIPISDRMPKDVLTWAFSNDGLYSVKTAYMLGKSCNLDDIHAAWLEIWKLNVTPKAKHFVWRVCTGTLRVRALLKTRHLSDVDGCPLCPDTVETLNHALFECRSVCNLWKDSGYEVLLRNSNSLPFGDLIVAWSKEEAKVCQMGVFLLWSIWNRRNDKIFNNRETPHNILLERVWKLTEDFNSYNQRIYGAVLTPAARSPNTWRPPPQDVVKLNCDAAVIDNGWVGMGVGGQE
ncbi:uncharacterized protein [Spinacia oleracea]|uniref:Reverse transcriptase domain-containing protein n=1 Tax=Spinacia oleracea TaxID=3562 RepID=A0ABM3RJK6_SPIOL|nr:uncharacterized protein LOC130470187 [Spinacia oleracea]